MRTYNRERGYYDEPYPSQQWNLLSDTATIRGYHCQKMVNRYAVSLTLVYFFDSDNEKSHSV
jgi:GLPGLI family protein